MSDQMKPKDVSVFDRSEQLKPIDTNSIKSPANKDKAAAGQLNTPELKQPKEDRVADPAQPSISSKSARQAPALKKVFQEAYFQKDTDASRHNNQRSKGMTALRGEAAAIDLKKIVLPEQEQDFEHGELGAHDGVSLFVQHVEQMQEINMEDRIEAAAAYTVSEQQEQVLQEKLLARQKLLSRFAQLSQVPSPTIQRLLASAGRIPTTEELNLVWDGSSATLEQQRAEDMLYRLKKMKKSSIPTKVASTSCRIGQEENAEEEDGESSGK